jgi:hypothetical protein
MTSRFRPRGGRRRAGGEETLPQRACILIAAFFARWDVKCIYILMSTAVGEVSVVCNKSPKSIHNLKPSLLVNFIAPWT